LLFILSAETVWAQTAPAAGSQPAPADPAQPAQPDPAQPAPADQTAPEQPAVNPEQTAQPPAGPEAPPPNELPKPEEAKPTFPTMGPSGNELVLSENFFIRFGLMLQDWTELLQDRANQSNGDDGGYQLNTFLRRARVFFGGAVFKKITYLFLLEGSNLGKATTAPDGTTSKQFNTLLIQDAWASFNFNPAFTVQTGLFLVPFCRNILQSTSTYLTLDVLATSATYIAATQTSTLRDTGLQIKGQLLGEHLEYRLAAFQGIRQSSPQAGAQGGKNPFRFAGYLQYNFLDPESGYVFNGHYFGKKRVAGVSAGFDYQKLDGADRDPYFAYSAAAFATIPLNGDPKSGGDEVAGIIQYLHFDPGTSAPTPPTPGGIAEQNDIGAELAYYNKGLHGSIFGKFEMRSHADDMFEAANLQIFGGGVKYYLAEAAANFTLSYNHIDTPDAPEIAPINPVNQLVLQIQLAYY
jgi:hypothetical protein